MNLQKLLSLYPDKKVLSLHSSEASTDTIFIAVKGQHTDGRLFISEALSKGAAVFYEKNNFPYPIPPHRTCHPILHLKEQIGPFSKLFYKSYLYSGKIIAITGSNGKTSICHWIHQALKAIHQNSLIIGTLGYGSSFPLVPLSLTTPVCPQMHAIIQMAYYQSIPWIILEASSIGLSEKRLEEVSIETAIFSNLSHEHLDYHGNMQEYFESKKKLFLRKELKNAIINIDDPYGKKILTDCSAKNIFTYGSKNADLLILKKESYLGFTKMTFSFQGNKKTIHIKTIGDFNVSNIMAVISALLIYNLPWDEIPFCLSAITPVEGRMNCWECHTKPLIILDYAHTPDALEKVLQCVQEIQKKKSGRIKCIFGCGGNRDKQKRKLMGKIASLLADEVILTMDNPRKEDPQNIFLDILAACIRHKTKIIIDRSIAIRYTINSACPSDIIVIAGKGSEKKQIIGALSLPFSDSQCIENALQYYKNV